MAASFWLGERRGAANENPANILAKIIYEKKKKNSDENIP